MWLVLLTACGALEGACVGVGFDEAVCREPLEPLAGPWVADLGEPEVCGVLTRDLADGWAVGATEDGAFALTSPDGASAECTVDEDALACAPVAARGLDLAVSGTLTSRSTAEIIADVTGDGCAATAGGAFVAAWKTGGAEPGDCPRDYDDYTLDPEGSLVPFFVDNRSGADIGIFTITEGSDVFTATAVAGAVTESGHYDGGWVALATDWGAENCAWFFQVEGEGHVEVYVGP